MQPVVLFDLDNTLVDRQLALARWAASFRSRHRLGQEDEAWLTDQLAERAAPGDFEAIRERLRLVEPATVLWDRYCTDVAAAVVCPPVVLAGLETLRADGWRIGIATNGAVDIQRAKLRATGIADRVDAVCTSQEVGARKPGSALFAEALRRCGGLDGGGRAWMVGDSAVNDIGGGRAAGLRTVWIDRGAAWPRELPEPDHQVPDARTAIDLLYSLGPRRIPL
ncbi:HAD-IA family hydrolase [Streptomyces sp. SID4919]|uniref:HAD family hydrolase n=1 Tax=unclassified Streptomyces TaxID=2593676 RepID=UPI000823B577|nr:HAD family hydrolase [Streptomyces sp. AmelKG-E11A]MYY13487.1 HAD-IA family hydrolase [Streptomyces sp. SID4919]SCK63117.1 putative hydrolase of the HAD superfamily [Streptomyces sp. AmelKG-E11A]